jgi:hypothetical protein
MLPHEKRTELSGFFRVYGYIVAAGILGFGIFAIYFQTYDHPLYGRIALGPHHVLIGVSAVVAGTALGVYLRVRSRR